MIKSRFDFYLWRYILLDMTGGMAPGWSQENSHLEATQVGTKKSIRLQVKKPNWISVHLILCYAFHSWLNCQWSICSMNKKYIKLYVYLFVFIFIYKYYAKLFTPFKNRIKLIHLILGNHLTTLGLCAHSVRNTKIEKK